MPHWQLFYHIVWATKYRMPILTPDVEQIVHGYLRTKAIGLGATVYALNGWIDHIHLIAAIPLNLVLGKFVGQVKAVASARYNKTKQTDDLLYWQDDYAIFSFDRKRLPNHVHYVQNQKTHHANHDIIPALEITHSDPIKTIKDETINYGPRPGYCEWFEEESKNH